MKKKIAQVVRSFMSGDFSGLMSSHAVSDNEKTVIAMTLTEIFVD
jgi:hypothetical protein